MSDVRYLKIKELPEEERPRERLKKFGPDALSTAELLAIILRTGTRKRSALELAKHLLKKFGNVKSLAKASLEELCEIDGIGLTKAIQIQAAFNIGKRFTKFREDEKPSIRSSRDVANLLSDEMRLYENECFRILLLNTKNQLMKTETISMGILNASLVHPREVFKAAIRANSASIIIVHNHPTGDPTPSEEDNETTKRIKEAGKLVGIELLDHIIIGEDGYFSYKDKDLL